MINRSGPVAAVMLGALAAGCGTGPEPPVDDVAAARTAVLSAEQAEAAAHAPAELDRARDKLARAEVALQERRNEDARRLAEQALADAQVAQARARSEVARRNAEEVRASIEALRTEATRQIELQQAQ